MTRRCAQAHPALLDGMRGQAALRAVQACMKTDTPRKCWDPTPRAGQPWAFYLPLGMGLAAQQSIMFMDCPPVPALLVRDYLDDFTPCRWTQVLNGVGVRDVRPLQTIVDARPIAAPGAGDDALMPDPAVWLDGATGAPCLTPLVERLATPWAAGATTMLPVAVFGASPRQGWGAIVGEPKPEVLDVGATRIGNDRRRTPWIVTDHPDVTTDDCCPGDPSDPCKPSGRDGNPNLIASEQTDFVAACWIRTMTGARPPSAAEAKGRCEARWVKSPGAADRQAPCAQAKLDNNNREARRPNFIEAWQYGAAHDANACASFDCQYDPAKATRPLPPLDQRPHSADVNGADRR